MNTPPQNSPPPSHSRMIQKKKMGGKKKKKTTNHATRPRPLPRPAPPPGRPPERLAAGSPPAASGHPTPRARSSPQLPRGKRSPPPPPPPPGPSGESSLRRSCSVEASTNPSLRRVSRRDLGDNRGDGVRTSAFPLKDAQSSSCPGGPQAGAQAGVRGLPRRRGATRGPGGGPRCRRDHARAGAHHAPARAAGLPQRRGAGARGRGGAGARTWTRARAARQSWRAMREGAAIVAGNARRRPRSPAPLAARASAASAPWPVGANARPMRGSLPPARPIAAAGGPGGRSRPAPAGPWGLD